MQIYLLENKLTPVAELDSFSVKQIVVLTEQEFNGIDVALPHKWWAINSLQRGGHCSAFVFGTCICGAIDIPNPERHMTGNSRVGIYATQQVLFLIDSYGEIDAFIHRMSENHFHEDMSVLEFLCNLINIFLDENIEPLQGIEHNIIALEDEILAGHMAQFETRIAPFRQALVRYRSFYHQLVAMVISLRANTNNMLESDDILAYGNLSDRTDRLLSYIENMREHTVQVRAIYESLLNAKQTRAMNILAVFSAVFLPLTLLTGWYGMNFANMPELTWKYGYMGVACLAALIIIVEIIIVKRKKMF